VIVGNRTSLPEVVGDAALAVDPFDVDALAGVMKKLVNDPALRNELSVKGQERAREFNWRETARKTLSVYKEVARVSVLKS